MTGDLSIVKDNAWLVLDSPSTGTDGEFQAAGISLGESGYKGSASLHFTYTGDGYGHIGMGPINTATSLPQFEAIRLYYLDNTLRVLGNMTVAGTASGTFTGVGTGLTLDAGNLLSGVVPINRLSGSYNINISGTAANATLATTATTAGNSSALNNLTATQLFNNHGLSHGTYQNFNDINDFGFRYVQNSVGGPGTGSSQFYGFSIGLGNEYAFSQYGLQLAMPRYYNDSYLTMRSKESGTWNAWRKISAGYADSAGDANTLDGLDSTHFLNAGNLTGTLAQARLSGSYNISISGNAATATNASYATNAGSAGNSSTALLHTVTDSRATVTNPQSINAGVVFDFKQNATEGLNDGGTYFGEMTFRQYGSSTDWSGGLSHQLGFTDNGNIWQRSGATTSWGTWKKLLDSSNYNSYSPTLSGVGATGTWGINITGSAGSAGSVAWNAISGRPNNFVFNDGNTYGINVTGNSGTATSSRYVQSPDGDRNPNNILPITSGQSVRFDFANAGYVGTGGNYAGVMTYAPWTGTTASTGDASYQLAFGSTATNGGGTPQLRIRKGIDSTWNSWYDLLTSANYNSFSPTLTGTGASGTWGINITGQAGTVGSITGAQVTTALGYTPANGSGAGSINGTQNYQDNILVRAAIQDYSLVHNSLNNVSGSTTVNLELGNYASATAVGAVTWTFANPPTGARTGSLILELTNGGAYTQYWPASVRWPSGSAPTLTSSGVDVLVFITDDAGSNWRGAITMADSR